MHPVCEWYKSTSDSSHCSCQLSTCGMLKCIVPGTVMCLANKLTSLRTYVRTCAKKCSSYPNGEIVYTIDTVIQILGAISLRKEATCTSSAIISAAARLEGLGWWNNNVINSWFYFCLSPSVSLLGIVAIPVGQFLSLSPLWCMMYTYNEVAIS